MNRFALLAVSFFIFGGFAHAEPVIDNSFLIEEAYNQEPGVVQFINGYQYLDPSHDWNYTFTNELPAPNKTHQISYVIPVAKKTGTTDQTGIGDVLVNYRYQLVDEERLAMAPRLSLILPTGDDKKGLGNGAVGLQFNQAVSIKVSDKWSNHWNVGFTYTPDAKNELGEKASLFGFNFGTSVVYYWTEKFNLLCEFVMNGNEEVAGEGVKNSANTYYIVPGFRTAFQAGKDLEIVPGIAAMLGVGPSAVEHERGVYAYLSFESKLW